MAYLNHAEILEDKNMNLSSWVLVSLYFEEVEI